MSRRKPRAAGRGRHRKGRRRAGTARRLLTTARRRLRKAWPSARTRKRWGRRAAAAPIFVQVLAAGLVLFGLWVGANGLYQVMRKPTELFFPIGTSWHKTPTATWNSYARLFQRHSTDVVTPELLAALAQVEGSGNPVVRTYWRWDWRIHPFEVYRPASSAVGMYQITDGTFERASRLCIHDHRVVEEGPWWDWKTCWFTAFYFRVVPSHAVEMTSAFLDRSVTDTLARHGRSGASPAQKARLATLIHLCGTGWANGYVRRGLAFKGGEQCGSHDPRKYVQRVEGMMRRFAALRAARDRGEA